MARRLRLQERRRGPSPLSSTPVDNLAPLAKAKIPLLLVYGDKGHGSCRIPKNSEVVFDRYAALGRAPVKTGRQTGTGPSPHTGLKDVTHRW